MSNADASQPPGRLARCGMAVNRFMKFDELDATMMQTPTCPKLRGMGMYAVRFVGLAFAIWQTSDWFAYDDWREWSHSWTYVVAVVSMISCALLTNRGIPARFLTGWGAVACTTYFALATLVALMDPYPKPHTPLEGGGVNPACCGGNWSVAQRSQFVGFQLVFVLQFTVVAMYWGAIYDWSKDESFDMSFFNNLSVHGIFLSFMIMELFVTRAQFYFRHLLVAFVVSCIYILINLISTLDYKPVYEVLDWEDGGTAFTIVQAYVLLFLGFLIGWGLTTARDRLCCSRGKSTLHEGQSEPHVTHVDVASPTHSQPVSHTAPDIEMAAATQHEKESGSHSN